jgi:hypothetical protein
LIGGLFALPLMSLFAVQSFFKPMFLCNLVYLFLHCF